MTRAYCARCREEKDMHVERREEVLKVKGEAICVESQVAVCIECGDTVFVKELEEQNLKRAYDLYRLGHKLLTSSEIRSIREDYGLTQGELAGLLGWGRITVSRYENGAIQSRGHDQTLKLLRDPKNLPNIVDLAAPSLHRQLVDKLTPWLEGYGSSDVCHSASACVSALLDSGKPSIKNGFRRFDLGRAHQAAAYLARSASNLFESKMTKLLWYADFLAYKSQARSITGCVYEAASFGPVPRRYGWLLNELIESGVLTTEEITFETESGSFIGKMYRPTGEFPVDRLSHVELRCLEAVALEFRDLSATKTVSRAHKEDAYTSVFEAGKQWKVMPYDLAETLSLEAVT